VKAPPVPTALASDFRAEGMLHLHTIRSPIAKGRVLSIDPGILPPGYGLILPADIPGQALISAGGARIPVLAGQSISYPGEPLALIYGPEAAKLEILAEAVKVECEEEWPLFSFESFSSDQILCQRRVSRGDAEGALSAAEAVLERSYRTGSQAHRYPEPQAASASLEYDKLVIRTATQWPFHVRASVASVLDIRPDDVVVKPSPCCAHMDGKLWYPSILAAQAALACILAKRPVLLVLSPDEDFLYTPKRARSSISLRACVDQKGGLRALSAQILLDLGAYGVFAEEMLERVCSAIPGPYLCPDLSIEAYALQTNNLPLGPLSGMGVAQGAFAMESMMSELAQAIEADPVEFRLASMDSGRSRRARSKGAGTPGGNRQACFRSLWERLAESSDFPRKYSSYELLRKRGDAFGEGLRRGIGLAFGFQGDGFISHGSPSAASVECLLSKKLNLEIRTSAVVSGADTRLVWKRLAARILGIREEAVSISEPSTDCGQDSGPAILSRNVSLTSDLVIKCAQAVQKARFRSPLPIRIHKAFKGNRAPAHARPGKADKTLPDATMDAPAGIEAFSSLTFGAAAVEVELDQLTSQPRVSSIWIVLDPGELLSPEGALAGIRSSAAAALAWASSERLDFVDGRIPPYLFWRYDVLRTDETPPIHVTFLPPSGEACPRGLGELAYSLVPAAYARAIAQASGFPADSLPVGIDRLMLEALGA